jgi:glycosyltransferase involved in cell wall biosynthesis
LDTDASVNKETLDKYSKYVKYLGRRNDIPKLLQQSDVFVLPTYYREGVPRVLLEASACGLAIITTNMPGCKDVVIDEYNGKLVKIKDSKDLSEKIIYLGKNREKIKIFGENAKEKVKEFDINKVREEYHEIYKKLRGDNANTIS